MDCSVLHRCVACSCGFFDLAGGALVTNGYLGKRYEVLMNCIRRGGKFTAYEMGVDGQMLKVLAERGYLRVVGTNPYSYVVPDRIQQRYMNAL